MLKNKFILLSFTAFVFLIFTPPTQAHELKGNGSIRALLHINPDDDPVAGQPSEILFLITDKAKRFNTTDCACEASVIENGQIVFSSALHKANSSYRGIFAPAIPYTFPRKGIYTVILTGKPKNPDTFESFSISYDVRIEKDASTPPESPLKNIIYYAVILCILAGMLYFVKLFFTKNDTHYSIDDLEK